MEFLDWLREQQAEKGLIGDFARDTFAYDEPTGHFRRVRELLEHMIPFGPCRGAKLAAVRSWRRWMAFRGRGRKAVSTRLRFALLKRDGYRCQLCGQRASEDAVLEIDHRVSVRDGGPTDEANLWTPCRACNRGKHAGPC